MYLLFSLSLISFGKKKRYFELIAVFVQKKLNHIMTSSFNKQLEIKTKQNKIVYMFSYQKSSSRLPRPRGCNLQFAALALIEFSYVEFVLFVKILS